ncbi:MAG: FAD-binding oxidoreductase [Rhodospirillales bacterium]
MRKEAPSTFWAQTATTDFAGAPLSEDLDCDVAIVGGGFTGLRAALVLAEAGSRVALLEAGTVGYGASGRNGGQVNPLLPVGRPEDLRRAVGKVYFERLAEVSLNSADALFTLVRDYQIDCQARQQGWLRVDHCAKARKTARAAAEAWRGYGLEVEFLERSDVIRLSGSKAYESGTLIPKGGAVQPLSLVRGLARAAKQAGAKIYEEAAVESLSREGASWLLRTRGGRVRADWVILATNGYTGDLWPGLEQSVIPISPVQIASDPLSPDVLAEILPQGHTIADTRRCIMYARREPGGQMVFGGLGQRTLHGRISGFGRLLRDAVRVFPQLREVTWTHRWGGRIAVTADRVPHFHEPEPGLIAGLGYNGRGVALSLEMGRVLAERALGSPAEALPFPKTEIAAQPFQSVQARGAAVALAWMRFRDRLEASRP